ncbi:MAG: prepilin-type N-terminal cleavage/methylation domain-containing protein [Chloroflexi bacterium]|nr:prepilin-type N-terminal cleavage/methylation domain-containing protein [Chloroflexota bacterium]
MRVRRKPLAARRAGFTLMEMLVAIAIGGSLMAATSMLLVDTLSGFNRQTRQGEMNWRVRIMTRTFTQDTEDTYQIVYSGTSSYTPPALVSPASYNTSGPNGQTITSVPAATKVLVFEVPSYDSSGYFIQNSYDYIGYSWTQPASGAGGILYRTCIPRTGSARSCVSQIIPAGGTYDATVTLKFHVSTTYTAIAGYGGNYYSDTATDSLGNPLFQGSTPTVGLAQVDEISLSITVQATSWGQTVSQTETVAVTMKEWGRTLGATGSLGTTGTTGATGAPSAPNGVSTASIREERKARPLPK